MRGVNLILRPDPEHPKLDQCTSQRKPLFLRTSIGMRTRRLA
jgi:hypothetical protein